MFKTKKNTHTYSDERINKQITFQIKFKLNVASASKLNYIFFFSEKLIYSYVEEFISARLGNVLALVNGHKVG